MLSAACIRLCRQFAYKKFGVRKIFFFKEMNTFIQQGCIKVIESDGKGINIILLIFLVNYL